MLLGASSDLSIDVKEKKEMKRNIDLLTKDRRVKMLKKETHFVPIFFLSYLSISPTRFPDSKTQDTYNSPFN